MFLTEKALFIVWGKYLTTVKMISTSGNIIFLSAQATEMQPWFPKKL